MDKCAEVISLLEGSPDSKSFGRAKKLLESMNLLERQECLSAALENLDVDVHKVALLYFELVKDRTLSDESLNRSLAYDASNIRWFIQPSLQRYTRDEVLTVLKEEHPDEDKLRSIRYWLHVKDA
ncbi:MAG: hypothetical protein K8I27_13155 [Planctomycetes bacterium]|nr:hypothetical protein [Planctomycetota bacterium]